MTDTYDYLVIGAGSGGLASAKRAASYGARVAIVEGGRYGGTCVNVGCVPKKLLHHGAMFGEALHDAQSFGWELEGEARFSLKRMGEASAEYIKWLNDIHVHYLDKTGVSRIEGFARFVDAHTIEVDGKSYSGKNILIATGGKPFLPDIPGVEHVITSDEYFDLRELPERVLVVGGGYISLEFAGMLRSFGSDVSLLHRNEVLLRGFDREIVNHVTDNMRESGIHMMLTTIITGIEERDGRYYVQTEGDARDDAGFDKIIYAVGRIGNVDKLNLEAAGLVADSRGIIETDDHERTAVDHIYAVGDVNGKVSLTPVAIQAGRFLADRLFDGASEIMDYENVPSAVFTPLEIGTVGLSEEAAREKYGDDVVVYRSNFKPLMHGITPRNVRVLMKMIVRKDDNVVVGLHIAGPDGAEIIHGFAVAVRAGLTKRDFDLTVGIHPTSGEEFVTMT